MSRKDIKPSGRADWMIVYTTHNLPEAHIVAGRLQHEGIPAFLDYQAGRGALGIVIGRLGQVNVVVHERDYARAVEILFADEVPSEPTLPDAADDTIIFDDDKDEDTHGK